jgi:hypothetical protein
MLLNVSDAPAERYGRLAANIAVADSDLSAQRLD